MNVKDIIKDWLIKNGCDGICLNDGLGDDERCGCGIDDLAPCGDICLYGQPAKKIGNKYYPVSDRLVQELHNTEDPFQQKGEGDGRNDCV